MNEKENEVMFYSLLNFHPEDGNILFLKTMLLNSVDEEFRPLMNTILEETGKPIEPISICPKCKSHVGVWTAYVGFNEYKCQTCGYKWEEYTD